MERMLRMCALAGMVWSALIGIYIFLGGLACNPGFDRHPLYLCIVMFVLWNACFHLYRFAAVLCCYYCWWMIGTSQAEGIIPGPAGWTLIALCVSIVVALNWRHLKLAF